MLLEGQCKMGSNPNPYSLIGQSLLGIAIKLSNHRVWIPILSSIESNCSIDDTDNLMLPVSVFEFQ